jgi:hypothetical protein
MLIRVRTTARMLTGIMARLIKKISLTASRLLCPTNPFTMGATGVIP